MGNRRSDATEANDAKDTVSSERETCRGKAADQLNGQVGGVYAHGSAIREMRNLGASQRHTHELIIAQDDKGHPQDRVHAKSRARDAAKDDATDPKYSPADEKALELIAQRISDTAEKKKHPTDGAAPAVSHKDDVQVSSVFDGRTWQKFGDFVDNNLPGDINQKTVSDLGIEAVPTADLRNSTGTTSAVDRSLAEARLDPKHYNCNDYVKMFVLSKESDDALASYIRERNGPTITDSPEAFLKQHKYKPIESGPLQQGDIIVIHGPKGEHAAVISKDDKTGQLYTMQKPNPKEMPVRLSLDQLSRAERISEASIEVYRK